jgi:hypothetical protein
MVILFLFLNVHIIKYVPIALRTFGMSHGHNRSLNLMLEKEENIGL